jgi:hypothetical protein
MWFGQRHLDLFLTYLETELSSQIWGLLSRTLTSKHFKSYLLVKMPACHLTVFLYIYLQTTYMNHWTRTLRAAQTVLLWGWDKKKYFPHNWVVCLHLLPGACREVCRFLSQTRQQDEYSLERETASAFTLPHKLTHVTSSRAGQKSIRLVTVSLTGNWETMLHSTSQRIPASSC